jgi:hypothetical protein
LHLYFDPKTSNDNICYSQLIYGWTNSLFDWTSIVVYDVGSVHNKITWFKSSGPHSITISIKYMYLRGVRIMVLYGSKNGDQNTMCLIKIGVRPHNLLTIPILILNLGWGGEEEGGERGGRYMVT